jgi:hypothetical protein
MKGGEKVKRLKMIILCAGVIIAVLASVTCVQGYIDYTYYGHYYHNLARSGAPGDCVASERYANVLQFKAGVASSSPTFYVYAGYIYDPDDWGSGHADLLTAPGWGPSAGSGSWYGIWGNADPNHSISTHDLTYALWP